MAYQTPSDHYQSTKYIVTAVGEGPYNTVQSAIDAANADGGGQIFIRPGTYTENLTLYANIFLKGTGLSTSIVGTHSLPATGNVTIEDLFLISATDVFNSALAGTGVIVVSECIISVTNGYTFNLPNWAGTIGYTNCIESITSTNNGFINCTGNTRFIIASAIGGYGTGNSMTYSNGSIEMFSSTIRAPMILGGTSAVTVDGGSVLHSCTTADTVTATIFNADFSSGATQSITHNSANAMTLSNITVNSTNPPPIGGSGTIDIGAITFLSEDGFQNTLTVNRSDYLDTGILRSAQSYHMYSGAGNVIDIVPDASIGADTWYGVNIDGTNLDPTVAGSVIHGLEIDFTGVDKTNDPHINGMRIQIPADYTGLTNGSAAKFEGDGRNVSILGATSGFNIYSDDSIGIQYDASGLTAGDSKRLYSSNVDITGSTGGDLHVFTASAVGAGSATVVGLGTFEGVDVIHQHIGTFGNVSQGWTYDGAYTDTTAAFNNAGTDVNVLAAQNDIVYIGSAAVFSEIECIFDTPANKDLLLTFEYSIAGPGWTTFNPNDLTHGFANNGIISFESSALAGWASVDVNGSTNYYIRITRGRATTAATTPIEDTIQILQPTLYHWDSSGDLEVASGSVVAGDFDVTRAEIGGNVLATIYNTDNTNTASNSGLILKTGGTGSGDPYVYWEVPTGGTFSAGIDNSDSDWWKLTNSSDPSSGTTAIQVNTSSNVQVPTNLHVGTDTVDWSQDLQISKETAGGDVALGIYNTSAVANSSSAEYIFVKNGAGDGYINFGVISNAGYALGIDNSDSDWWKLTATTTHSISPSSGTTALQVNTSGNTQVPTNLHVGDTSVNFTQDLKVAKATSGSDVSIGIYNTSNTASSTAFHSIYVAGSTAGDAYVNFGVVNVAGYALGIDNSDSDIFKLNYTNDETVSPSTGTTYWQMTTAGERTMPLQPAFATYVGSDITNVTGDGTAYTIAYDTEIFDQNSDLSGSTFTAPVTGRYLITAGVSVTDVDAAMTTGYVNINTSNRDWYEFSAFGAVRDVNNSVSITNSIVCDMDAADTVNIIVKISNSGKTADIIGDSSCQTYFTGSLIC